MAHTPAGDQRDSGARSCMVTVILGFHVTSGGSPQRSPVVDWSQKKGMYSAVITFRIVLIIYRLWLVEFLFNRIYLLLYY